MDESFLNRRRDSFRNAFRGISGILKSQVNFIIHLTVLALVIAAGVLLRITPAEWTTVILAAGLVLAAECLNSALELLGDAITTDKNPLIRKAKDMAAAGVLVSAIAAAAVGLIIFVPAIMRVLR